MSKHIKDCYSNRGSRVKDHKNQMVAKAKCNNLGIHSYDVNREIVCRRTTQITGNCAL